MSALAIDHIKSDDRDKAIRRFFSGACEFLLGAADLKQLPPADRPEIAFAGRSNVGKSTLLNAMVRRKALARTSTTPGRTRQLNYFTIGDEHQGLLYLVDLPGYGFAKAPRQEIEAWTELTRNYLRGRATLRRVMLLVDGRHGLKASDHLMIELLNDSAVNYQIILTKLDKIKTQEMDHIQRTVAKECEKFPACHPKIISTSALKDMGLDDLRLEAMIAGEILEEISA